jgi:hypothetical protein
MNSSGPNRNQIKAGHEALSPESEACEEVRPRKIAQAGEEKKLGKEGKREEKASRHTSYA